MSMPNVDRPNPLKQAAKTAGAAWASLAGLVGLASGYGLVTQAQADAIATIGRELPGWLDVAGPVVGAAVAAGATLLGAFGATSAAKPHVTPSGDERDHDGTRLVREDELVAEAVPDGGSHRLDG